jgi:hypothetical protein
MGNQKPRLSAAARSAAADAVLARLDGGRLAIYCGEPPPTPDDEPHGAVLLVELPFAAERAFQHAVAGVASAYPLGCGTAVGSGTATFFLCHGGDPNPVLGGLVGSRRTDGDSFDLNLSDTAIRAGATVAITSFQYRQAG